MTQTLWEISPSLSIAKSRCGGLHLHGQREVEHMACGKSRGRSRKPQTLASSAATPPTLPLKESPKVDVVPIDALMEDTLCLILHHLIPADLLHAALACHRWHHFALVISSTRPTHLARPQPADGQDLLPHRFCPR
jgi:hypothetical protein